MEDGITSAQDSTAYKYIPFEDVTSSERIVPQTVPKMDGRLLENVTGIPISQATGKQPISVQEKYENDTQPCVVGQSELSLSETFITLETKDGVSTEKMPFLQFMRNMMVDPQSGNFKEDLLQLLSMDADSSCQEGSDKTMQESHVKKTGHYEVQIKPAELSGNKTPDLVIQQQDHLSKGKSETDEKNEKCVERKKVGKGKFCKNSHKSETLFEGPSANTKFKDHPRRSRRVPAKNKRFGDFVVESSTLGKITGTPWNTQLMTLALAAECHENEPENSVSLPQKATSRDKTVESDTDIDGAEGISVKSFENPSNGIKIVVSEPNEQQNKYAFHAAAKQTPIEKKVYSSVRGPKTLKKYEAVNPVVKRNLEDALSLCISSTKSSLSEDCIQFEEISSNNPSYYVVLEPKLSPSGSGLLVHKSNEGLRFRNAQIKGAQPLPSADDESYPQDRYFSCDICTEVFTSSSNWLQHNNVVHQRDVKTFESVYKTKNNTEVYQCSSCDQHFPYQFMLDIHVKRRRHNDSKSFRCTLCKLNFSGPKEREEHWIIAHPARSCGLCGKQFTNIVMLRRHINNSCHGARFRKKIAQYESIDEENSSGRHDVRMVTQEGFPEEYVHIEEMVKEERQEEIEGEQEDTDGGQEEIDVDGEVDNVYCREDIHSNQDNIQVLCELCGNEFSTRADLWRHKLDVHQQYFPSGYAERLQERLQKNQSTLLNSHIVDPLKPESKGNNFFVIMKPTWPSSRSKVVISVDNKEFVFKTKDETITENSDSEIQTSQMHGEGNLNKKITSFQCDECTATFEYASVYRDHRSHAHGECFETVRLLGAFQCSHCSDTFPCQFMLDEHLKKHKKRRNLPCTLCGLEFHKIQERRQHWKTVHPGIGCPNCGKMYASIKYLQKHIALNCQDHFPATKKFLEFRKKQHSDFEMEKSEKRVEKKIIRCHLCPKINSSVHGWRRHMGKFHEDSGFSKLSNTCIICNELVYGYKALEKHLLEFHAEESGLPVDEENNLVEAALKKCSMDITDYRKAGINTKDIAQDEEGNYHCPVCPKTHTDIKALRTHIKTHVNMELECNICQKSFKNPTLLKQHVQRHRSDSVYSCVTCEKKFMTLQKLNKHRKLHQEGQEFTCELCGMTFSQNEYLQKHLAIHTDKRPHVCSVCGKTFRTKPELRVHILIHTRETPFVCQHCGRGFSQKGNYRVHLAQHTGEKPYKCDQCDISFTLSCHLKRHKITHEQKINYRCIWCGKECTQRKHMQMHVMRIHKEDFFQFEEQMKLETPLPISPSQIKLYNRKISKVSKFRKAYKTRAQKCVLTFEEIMNVKSESNDVEIEVDPEQNIEMEPLVEPIIETASVSSELHTIPQSPSALSVLPSNCFLKVASAPYSLFKQKDLPDFEILVSDDHQNIIKHSISPEVISQDVASNLEIVMGENNEINIIIKDPSTLQCIGEDDSSISHFHVDDALQDIGQPMEVFVDTKEEINEDT